MICGLYLSTLLIAFPHIYNVSAYPSKLVSIVTPDCEEPNEKSIIFPFQSSCPCGVIIIGFNIGSLTSPFPICPLLLSPHI
jgi:hypothetical protein